MGKRFLNMTFALGLVVGLMAGVVGSASADTSPAGTASQWIYFPWVPNGEMMDNAGPWYGTVTIQNLENYRVIITLYDEAGGTTNTTTLEPNASKTMSADQLGVASPGGAVAVQSAWDLSPSGQAQTLYQSGNLPAALGDGDVDQGVHRRREWQSSYDPDRRHRCIGLQ